MSQTRASVFTLVLANCLDNCNHPDKVSRSLSPLQLSYLEGCHPHREKIVVPQRQESPFSGTHQDRWAFQGLTLFWEIS